MSEEEPQAQSIQARIAALKLNQVGRAPITATNPQAAFEKPVYHQRSVSSNVPPVIEAKHTTSNGNGIGNQPNGSSRVDVLPPPSIIRTGQKVSEPPKPKPQPNLPARKVSAQPSPALPPRRPSEQLARRDSNGSLSSVFSTTSSVSNISNGTRTTLGSRTPSVDAARILAPAYDPSTLPILPPKKAQQEKDKTRLPLKATKSTPTVLTTEVLPPPNTPALPERKTPTLPDRPAIRERLREPERRLPPREPPPMPSRPNPCPRPDDVADHIARTAHSNGNLPSSVPPPIPLGSRPDLSRLLATKPKPQSASASSSCLKCRDFSAPDNHAAQFPRQSVPSLDWLATQLTSQFPSQTDKARAIFTWLHHNVAYDVVSFFNDAVKPSTPANTLSTGLAVCEGYAGLFTALASKAGLESVVVGGHGKGYGFSTLAPGSPLPAFYSTHAWNVVKIDHGEWKLIDCCWGAGTVSGKGQPYNKAFNPRFFTMDNNEFGLRHYPTNQSHFFRTDGRSTIFWEEYIVGDRGGERTRVYSNIAPREGLSETSFQPKYLKIPLSQHDPNSTIRFQFEKVCAHWDPYKNGPGAPYCYILAVEIGNDGRAGDYVPFDTNGMVWWVDVPVRRLGVKGATVSIYTVESVNGQDGRGLSKTGYLEAKGKKGMGFGGVAAWELA